MQLKVTSRFFRFCAVACLAAFGLAASEHHGLVKFGAVPIPGATVTATKDDKKVVAITDEAGVYTFPDLEDGTWKVQVEMQAFAPASKEIGVAPNAPGAEWDLKLMSMDAIKPILQTAAPASTPATAPAAGAPASTAPAAGQPAATQTAAGKPPAKGKAAAKGAAPATPQTGFQRTDVNASADSGAVTNTPSIATPEATQVASDAFVVNGSTSNGIERRAIGNGRRGPRSLFTGGIDFRGFQNDLLNARSYATTGQDVPRAPYTQYTAGASVQGPLWVPHVFRFNGNFFLNAQTNRMRQANNNPTVMPTAAEKAGDFSQVTDRSGSPIVIRDPATGNPFPNNAIPGNKISDQAKALLPFYPSPQFTAIGSSFNYEIPIISRSVQDQLQVRINKPIGTQNKNSLNGGFTFQTGSSQNPNVFSFLDRSHTSNYGANISWNHTFTRTLRGTLTANYSRSSILATPFFANKTNVSGNAGISGNDQTPVDYGPPAISFQDGSSIATLSDGNPSFNRNQTLQLGANVQYLRRPHTFTIAGNYRVQDYSAYSQSNGRGQFGFTGATTGFGFASFLLGLPDSSQIAFGNADKYLRGSVYNLAINDDWKVSPSVSVQWGLRWDYEAPITEKYGRLVNLDIAPGFTAATPVEAFNPTGTLTHRSYPDSLMKPDKHEIEPRLAFAWKPIFGSSMLVRGGWGVYYNQSVYSSIVRNLIQQYPLSKSVSVTSSPTNPLTLANGFNPNLTGVTADTYAVDPDFRVGYSQNWYVSIQQNVTASMVMTVQYTGVKGTRAAQEFQPNTYPAGAINPCPSCLAGYTFLASNGNSTRHGGTISMRRRFHGGLTSQFQYTYAKAIDDSGGLGSSAAPLAQNWLNLSGERGLSNFDQRHNFQANFAYSTGVGVRGGALLGGWRGLILKGWTISGNLVAGSGSPFSPILAGATTITGSQSLRPEYVGGSLYSNVPGRFLNPLAFGAPPLGQWGDAPRDFLIGPNQFSFSASAARSFADHISATFNSTNVLNHPVFSSVNSQFNPNLANGGSFGIFNPPGGMRNITATLRWTF